MSPVTVTVPATTANLGPGFDCIGAALTLYNRFQFTLLEPTAPPVKMQVTGVDAQHVSRETDNVLYQAFVKVYRQLGQTPPAVEIKIELGVPLSRGLGSSATAIVGGIVGANLLTDRPLEVTEIMELAIALEGHPDNVVPALLGGCRLAVERDRRWQVCEIPWHRDLIPVVAIPDFELSTKAARAVLPSDIPRADAIFNLAHFGLLLRGLETANPDWLQVGMQDRLHQPYRQPLIRGYDAVRRAAIAAGAYEVAISGAGPTLLALTNPTQSQAVANAMTQAWQALGVTAIAQCLSLDSQGTRY